MNKTSADPVELCGMNTRVPADSKQIVPCVLGLRLLQLQLSPLQLSPLQLSPLLHCPHLVRFPSLLLGTSGAIPCVGGQGVLSQLPVCSSCCLPLSVSSTQRLQTCCTSSTDQSVPVAVACLLCFSQMYRMF